VKLNNFFILSFLSDHSPYLYIKARLLYFSLFFRPMDGNSPSPWPLTGEDYGGKFYEEISPSPIGALDITRQISQYIFNSTTNEGRIGLKIRITRVELYVHVLDSVTSSIRACIAVTPRTNNFTTSIIPYGMAYLVRPGYNVAILWQGYVTPQVLLAGVSTQKVLTAVIDCDIPVIYFSSAGTASENELYIDLRFLGTSTVTAAAQWRYRVFYDDD